MVFVINFVAVFIYYILIKQVMKNKDVSYKVFIWIATIHAILFRIITCPFQVDDAERYVDAYAYISEMTFNEAVLSLNYYTPWGQGFVFFNWLLSVLSNLPIFLFISASIISVGGVMLYYKKTSYALLVTISMYLIYPMLYLMGFGVIRQHMAVVFVLFALFYVNEWKKSLTLAIIGFLIHNSAIVFFPFLIWNCFFKKHSQSLKYYFIIVVLIFMLRFFIIIVVAFLPRYLEVLEEGEKTNNIIPLILLVSLSWLFYKFRINRKINTPLDFNIFSYTIYGIFVAILGLGIPGAGRLTLYNVYVIPVALTLLYKYSPHKRFYVNMYYYAFMFLSILLISIGINGGERYAFYYLWEKINVF